MNPMIQTIIGLTIPLLGTTLGASMVFLLKHYMKPGLQKLLLGFASGVMIAASVWSLLIPALDLSEHYGAFQWVPAAVGFLLGMGFLLLLDTIIPHLHMDSTQPEGAKSHLSRGTMLILAVTLHNIPEGMAVGVLYAGVLSGSTDMTLLTALALSIGIAMQNIPEGAVISMPLVSNGISKRRAFGYGVMSGAVEPLAAALTIGLTGLITPVLPYVLAFAAGAMVYVVVEELIPEAQSGKHSNIGTIGVAAGFVLMMILDVALG